MAEIKSRIRVKRCTNTSLSSHKDDILPAGAPLYNTDTNELFVGENDKLEDKRAVTSGELRYKDVRVRPSISSSGKNRVDIMGDSEINIEGERTSSLLIRHISPPSGSYNSGLEITTDDNDVRTSAGGINIGIGPTTAQTNCITIGTKIGQNSPDSKNSSIAIGSGSTKATGNNSIAIGNEITADKDNQVVLGNYDFSKIFENDTITAKAATMLASLSRGSFYTSKNEVTNATITYNGYRVFLGKCDVPGSITKKDTYLTFVKGENAIQFTPNFRGTAVVIKSHVKAEFNEKFLYCFVSRDVHGVSSDFNEGAGFASDISDDGSVLKIHPNNSVGNPTLIIISTLDNYYYDTEE